LYVKIRIMDKMTEKDKADIAFKNYVIDKLTKVEKMTKQSAKAKAKTKRSKAKSVKRSAPQSIFGHGLATFKTKITGSGKG